MFFSTYVLTKKGPLAKVWLAAHWDKRLTRNEVKIVDLRQTILHIVRPVVPIALRTSGELLVGVVRIYALKVKHLLKEATEATLVLRVTTLASKSGRSATSSAAQRITSVDGTMVGQKGELEAVTMDWAAELAARHGSVEAAADALHAGRFDAIADLLGPTRRVGGVEAGKEDDGLLASAWYTVQPASQAAEEVHNSQQDYDEIARMRADLLALGARQSGSESTSKSKSSLASLEKGRGSVDGGLQFHAVGDEFDLGVPLPDELPLDFPVGVDGAVDPFLLPDVMTADPDAPLAVLPRGVRKPRPVNVLDLASTTLSREAFERGMADRSDITSVEPRRGPYDAQEAADRSATAGAIRPVEAVPHAPMLGDTLRETYVAALAPSIGAATAAAAAARRVKGRADSEELAAAAGVGAAPEDAVTAAEVEVENTSHRKRGRGEEETDDANGVGSNGGLSASARQTLERLRTELSRTASSHGRKKPRLDLPASALVGESCTLGGVCHGLRRREAARTFVDALALASKQYVAARQEGELGEIVMQLNESAVSLLAAA